ncbi:MAG: TIGR03862 family flavoprotein [Rhodobacteraceae bacterium]|nr:TIGR03862 family flavoprotein [Paracoccaceae bacterium]
MTPDALVVGAGPAGLMAADRLLAAGCTVLLAEAKPSPARKLLMAGKSGLNITKDESFDTFLDAYAEAAEWLRPMLTAFGPQQVQEWAQALGQEVFTGSSGRVFPRSMKASPLLRHWMTDLATRGLTLRTRWRWTGDGTFDTPDGPARVNSAATVLALGGASWSRLGSDGRWAGTLAAQGVTLAPFRPANMGFDVRWSAHMNAHFGQPLKNIALIAGAQRVRGEAVISAKGIEGGGIYAVSRAIREGAALQLDLFPDISTEVLVRRLSDRPRGESTVNTLRKLGLADARLALALECARPFPVGADDRARMLKNLPVPTTGPRPMDEAISTAGGIPRSELTDDLMLRKLPGTFAAGEMLDWEAPTGGYLLTASLATGRWAGDAAAQFIRSRSG